MILPTTTSARPSLLYKAMIVLIAVMMVLPLPAPVDAAIFNPHYLLSDGEMRDHDAMSFSEIFAFLDGHGGLNSAFDVDAVDGLLKGTAQLVDDAAKRYRINPKYILVLLQKESGIVETGTPTQRQLDWASGYALCDGCYRSSTLAQKYKGFAKQIDAGAGWMDWYLTNAPSLTYLKQPGVTYTISSLEVTPANLTTAALYNYTPHIAGNRLFRGIWNRWFGDGSGMQYPDGTLLRDDKTGAVVVMQNGKARPILNESVLLSRFNPDAIIDVNTFDFASMLESNPGRPISFPDIALVRTEDSSTYLLVRDMRRRIPDAATFSSMGFNPEEVEDVASADLEGYVDGPDISLNEEYPAGQLLQDTTTGGVYYAEAGVKHPLWDRAILITRFAGRSILAMDAATLGTMPTGDPVTLPEGILAKTADDPTVYVIADGYRRPIPSETVFLAYGYRWANVVTTSVRALSLSPLGDPLLLVDEPTASGSVEI